MKTPIPMNVKIFLKKWRSEKKKNFCARQSYILYLLLPAMVLIAGCNSEECLKETEQSGNQIVGALESYHARHYAYPPNLEGLIPGYLLKIPQPTWGVKKWTYEVDDDKFDLRVNESTRTGDGVSRYFRYQGKESGWQTGN